MGVSALEARTTSVARVRPSNTAMEPTIGAALFPVVQNVGGPRRLRLIARTVSRMQMVPFLSLASEGFLALEAPGRREMSGATKEIGAPEYRIGKFQWNFVLTPRETMISDPVLGPVVTARK